VNTPVALGGGVSRLQSLTEQLIAFYMDHFVKILYQFYIKVDIKQDDKYYLAIDVL